MKTVALRFSDKFAPEMGTIKTHEQLMKDKGFVWYGKLGLPLSQKAIDTIMNNENPKILLVHSGRTERYWAYVTDITRNHPDSEDIPEYYRNKQEQFRTWFKIILFENAPKNIMGKCRVISSGAKLGEVSKHSMSPYFIIEVEEE